MITFATLLLGLVLGPQEIELAVGPEVAAVEAFVDGESVAKLAGEPWTFDCDLGPELRPHLLEAVAYDAYGTEIGRVHQGVNLPRSRAEAALVLERDANGRPTAARLIWRHIEFEAADRIRVQLDGRNLDVTTTEHIPLPPLASDVLHTIEAELSFPDGTRYRAELGFGGRLGRGADIELTGLALKGRAGALPALEKIQGWFSEGGHELDAVGVERSPGKVVMVVDETAAPALRELAQFGPGLVSRETAMREGEQAMFLFPRARVSSAVGAKLFGLSQAFFAAEGGSFPSLLTRVAIPEPAGRRRVTDALAVAAVEAATDTRPRAVVLVLGHEDEDVSAYQVDEVHRFLDELGVPLVLWWTGRPQSRNVSEDRRPIQVDTPWGRARDISSVNRLMSAGGALRDLLDQQVIVWLRGRHMPHRIEIASRARGLELLAAADGP